MVGDVALYYLPYVQEILSRFPSAKFVVLQRARVETIRSYVSWVPQCNHWMRHDGSEWNLNNWDSCYPKYEAESREEALGQFWDDYYGTVELLCKKYSDAIRLFRMEELNSSAGVRRILDFCGFDEAKVTVGIHRNQGRVQPAGGLLEY